MRWGRSHALAAAALALILVAAPVFARGTSRAPRHAATTVDVVERDFHVAGPAKLPSGDVTLRVTNRGPDRHELIVVRQASNGALPMRTDGLTLDEDALEDATVGVLEPGEPGVRLLAVHLTPGRYELFCNMSGHYLGGMHHTVVVS